jgi:hypothetical protein
MKLSTLVSCSLLAAACAWQVPASAMTQQEKMTACNNAAAAKHLSGDPRKAFMSDCLSAKSTALAAPAAPAAPMTQQEKMTACNKAASAKSLSGDARKSFMSDCLKTKKPSAA